MLQSGYRLQKGGTHMTTQSEKQLENGLIKHLVQNGYERAMIPNVAALTKNFRNQMNRLNAENLNRKDSYGACSTFCNCLSSRMTWTPNTSQTLIDNR